MDLDHVALGLHDANAVAARLVGDLGADLLHGGLNLGFRVVQLRVGRRPHGEDPGDGMTIELIEPWVADRFDFLARFIARHGDGPHHMTFKVDDIQAQLARMADAGLQPTSTNLSNPWWREAFFHPAQTHGTVVQIAQTDMDPDEAFAEHEHDPDAEFGPRRWWDEPPPRAERWAVLRRVVMGVTDVAAAAAFYEGLLDGNRTDEGDGWIETRWKGGGQVRFEPCRAGARPGVDRLECEWDGAEEERVIGGTRFRLLSR